MNLFIESYVNEKIHYIVEPELVSSKEKKLSLNFENLKICALESIERYVEAVKDRPPEKMKLVINPDFIISREDVSPEEYSLLCTLSDYNCAKDIYSQNEMLDYDITNAFITLRKKEAIKVIETR